MSGVCVCPLTECVSVAWAGDVETHEKLSSLKNSKYNYFDIVINVFLLAVCSPIFGYVTETLYSESRRQESEWEERSGKTKKRRFFLRCGRYRNRVTWPAPNNRIIFARENFLLDSKRLVIVEDTLMRLLWRTRFPKLIYFGAYFCFGNKFLYEWVLNPIFPGFSTPCPLLFVLVLFSFMAYQTFKVI